MLDFSDPSKWVIQRNVPVLDEHELTDEQGRPEGFVDAKILQEIAENNNRRIAETGDAAPLIVGHTEDGVNAKERPVVGFAINYRVRPFKQGRQAIYCDFAVRRKYANVLEDYPRRSVELWLSKRELDPIALLGGSTPERNLGVIVRKARGETRSQAVRRYLRAASRQMHFQAVALLGSTAPARDLGVVLKYSRAGGGNVLRYAMEEDGDGKVGKVMHEFAHGQLHSGSKHGPKVTSRAQAVAIAMHEAGKSRPDKHEREGCGMPGGHMNYADDEFEGDTNNGPGAGEDDGYDGGDREGGGADDAGMDGSGDPFDAEAGQRESQEDPEVARICSSKSFKMMLQQAVEEAIQAALGPEPGSPGGAGAGGPPGGGTDGMDDGMGAPMGGAGMGAGPPGGMGGPPDEEAAMFHGAPPVRFEQDGDGMDGEGDGMETGPNKYGATGFAGPATGYVAGTGGGMGGGKRSKPFSRNGNGGGSNVNGTANRRTTSAGNSEVIRLKRQVTDMALKLARADAEKAVAQLKTEGVVFGESREEAERNEREETEFLAQLDPQSQAWHLARVRKLYKRREHEPAQPGPFGPLSRYARGGVEPEAGSPDDPNDFTPGTPQEAMEYAQAIRAKGPVEAIKYMRSRGKRR